MFPIQQEESKIVSKKAAEVAVNVAFALLAVFIIVNAARLDYMSPFGPGAGFFPL